VPRIHELTVEPLGRDAVAMTQCMAIDADAFPYASVQFGVRAASLRVLVARDEREGRIVGFLAGNARRGALSIHGLAVDRAVRRRGVGRALVRDAAARARAEGLRALVLQVGVGNRAAVALYESEGFQVVRQVRGYYPRGLYGDERDAYQMVLPL
jgi:tRNA threonylcarbamoyladenosine biosynthesis protein TsaB